MSSATVANADPTAPEPFRTSTATCRGPSAPAANVHDKDPETGTQAAADAVDPLATRISVASAQCVSVRVTARWLTALIPPAIETDTVGGVPGGVGTQAAATMPTAARQTPSALRASHISPPSPKPAAAVALRWGSYQLHENLCPGLSKFRVGLLHV